MTRYTPAAGPHPARTRTGPDPLDRQEWFRAHPRLTSGRVTGLRRIVGSDGLGRLENYAGA